MLVGVDVGTSGAKAVLMEEDGEILAARSEEYGVDVPKPGWAEQPPEIWVEKASRCIRAVVSGHERAVGGVAFSGQMHGIALVGKDGRPVRNAILWADGRSGSEAEEIPELVGRETFLATTLNRVAAGYGLATLLWLARHEPETLDKTAYMFCPKDYLRFRLGGAVIHERTDASGTCCLDAARREWAREIFATLNLPSGILPPLADSTDEGGTLSASGAALCGLPAGTPLYCGCADNAAAGIGAGLADAERAGLNIGTGGQIGVVGGELRTDPEYRLSTFLHPIDGCWNIYGATLAAGLSLKWFRDAFCPGRSFAELDAMASQAAPGARGLLFLPYLVGERSPWLDPQARGIFFGLSLKHGLPEMCRAVMEGVVFALEQSYAILSGMGLGRQILLSMGGGARSAPWRQIQAGIFGLPVETASEGDACVGAAILAGVGSGIYGSIAEGCAAVTRGCSRRYEPDPKATALYAERKQAFRSLYLANRDLFREEAQRSVL